MCFYMLAEYKHFFKVGNLDAFFSTAGKMLCNTGISPMTEKQVCIPHQNVTPLSAHSPLEEIKVSLFWDGLYLAKCMVANSLRGCITMLY